MEKTNDTIKSLYVAFCDSTGGALKCRRTSCLNMLKNNQDYKVVKLEYVLNCGNISDAPFSNAAIYEEFFFDNAESIYNQVQNSIEIIYSYNKKVPIELFINSDSANELCNFYYFINVFKDLENVHLNYFHKEIEEVFKETINAKVFDTLYVVDKREKLTKELVEKFSSRWQKLVSNNNAVRECKDRVIKEYSLHQAQSLVLEVFKNEYRRFPKIYGEFMDKYTTSEYFDFDYIAFSYITKTLIDAGLIERTKNTDTQSGCSDIYYEQCFRRIKNDNDCVKEEN